MTANHELGWSFNQSLVTKQNYIENKNKQSQSASGLYYGIVGNVTVYNRTYDRYHVTIPELNNTYYQNVPRRHDAVTDGGGSLSTLKEGDNVLVSFEGGKLSNPIIIGSQFYTGDPSKYIQAINKGTLDSQPNVILPPTAQGEAIKAMASSGGTVQVQTKDTTQPNTSKIRATLKSNVVVGLDVFNKTTGIKTSVTTSKEVIVTNGSKYETVTGNQYSVSEGLLSKAKQEANVLSESVKEQVQKYTAISAATSPLDVTYVASPLVVVGQVLVNSKGDTYNYKSNTSSGSSSLVTDDKGNVTSSSVTKSTSINYDKINKKLTVISDTLKTSKEQTKYEQEVLLPCVENIKNVWKTANYLLNNKFEYSKPKFSLSYLCNLGSFKLKASFPPIGEIEQQIDYCAPSWLSVPLLVVKGLYDLGCSNAWKTDFLADFASSVNNEMSLMICCDDNGLPVLGYNVASSIDISSAYAISGAPIPLRDTGELPNSVTIRPNSNTTIRISAPDIIKDNSSKPSTISQKTSDGTLESKSNYIPSSKSTIDLEAPSSTKPELQIPASSDEENVTITEPYNDNQDLPVGLVEYDTPLTQLSLDLPLPTYNFVPYKVIRDNIANNPYSSLENTFVSYGIPNSELLLSELKYLVKTKSAHNFFQVMSLVSQKPLVALVFNLINVYIQGDLNLNQYIYKLKINRDISSDTINLFNYASNRNLNLLTTSLNSYYGIEVDFLSWVYYPTSMLDWIVIQEPAIQPLFVSLQQAAIEDFCVLLIRVFNGVDIKAYDNLYKIYISLCQQALNLEVQGANFYGSDIMKVYIPEVQLG